MQKHVGDESSGRKHCYYKAEEISNGGFMRKIHS